MHTFKPSIVVVLAVFTGTFPAAGAETADELPPSLRALAKANDERYPYITLRNRSALRIGLQADSRFVSFPRIPDRDSSRSEQLSGPRVIAVYDIGPRFRVFATGAVDWRRFGGHEGGMVFDGGLAWFIGHSAGKANVELERSALDANRTLIKYVQVPKADHWLFGPRAGFVYQQWAVASDQTREKLVSPAAFAGLLLAMKENVEIRGLNGTRDEEDSAFELFADGLLDAGGWHESAPGQRVSHKRRIGYRVGLEYTGAPQDWSPWGQFAFRLEGGRLPFDSGGYWGLGIGWGAATLHECVDCSTR